MNARVELGANYVEFACPGCGQRHVLSTDQNAPHPRWVFSGDAQNPTLSPSILARGMLCVYDDSGEWTGDWKLDASGQPIPFVCHSFVRAGRIEFLGDCTHELRGQTVDMLEVLA